LIRGSDFFWYFGVDFIAISTPLLLSLVLSLGGHRRRHRQQPRPGSQIKVLVLFLDFIRGKTRDTYAHGTPWGDRPRRARPKQD